MAPCGGIVLEEALDLSFDRLQMMVMICPSVSCCSSHVFHLCCCYTSGVPCFNGPGFAVL